MRWGMPSNSSIGRRFCIAMETTGSRNMTFLGIEKIPQKYQMIYISQFSILPEVVYTEDRNAKDD